MADSEPGWLRRTLGGFLRLVDATRRLVLNVLFLLIVVVLAVALFTSSRPRLSENTALVVVLRGDLVEQYSGSAREAQLAEALGGVERETQLRDVVAVLDAAARDPNIARAVLILDDMGQRGHGEAERSRSRAGTVPLGRQADPGVGFADEPGPVLPGRARRIRSTCIRAAPCC